MPSELKEVPLKIGVLFKSKLVPIFTLWARFESSFDQIPISKYVGPMKTLYEGTEVGEKDKKQIEIPNSFS